ncbi:F0F1 ATP synthase subunit B [Streptomyces sp. NPDC003077]|uniref:F0F1 ATP synthase subunit B n=1 Tax=Streptomyces sp. NPDC003077 TaxID=3154443 RepID=UPI0033ABE63F
MNALVTMASDVEVPENPLFPPIPELVIGLIAFFIVFGFLAKKLLPNINKVLDERREAIEGGMEKADAALAEAQQVLEDYRAQLADARHEAARLRQEAQEQGAALIAEMRAEGQRQREEIIAAGHAQIEADRKQAAQSLRQDVGKLATDLAGKLVGESLEDHARQSRTIDRFLDELEAKAASGATKAEAGR